MDEKDNINSWAGLALVTVIIFFDIGTIKAFSVLLQDVKEQLSTQTWIVGSCISIIIGWGYLLGLSASTLVSRFGHRSCLMTSGLVSSLGLIVCASATNVHILLCGLLLTGFFLLQENVAIGIVPGYFTKYYSVAVNVYGFGNALAMLISPVFTQVLLDTYGWRGALLMLSGLSLHCIPFGALLKQRKAQKTKGNESRALIGSSESSSTTESCKSRFLKYILAVHEACDATLLTNVSVITRVLVPSFTLGFSLSAWLIYIITYALSTGASMRESSIVATCGGIGLAISKIALILLNRLVPYRQLLYISSFVMAFSFISTTLFDSVFGMSVSSITIGISFGIAGTEMYVAARDVSSEAEYVNAVAWCHLVYGLASIFSGTVTGLIFDLTGNFAYAFALICVVSLLTAISLGLEDLWTYCKV